MPTLRQLEYLVVWPISAIFLAPPNACTRLSLTLSEQLQVLEARLGVQLIERSRGDVVVTPIGLKVAEIGRRILRDVQRIRDIMRDLGMPTAGAMGVTPAMIISNSNRTQSTAPRPRRDVHAPSCAESVKELSPRADDTFLLLCLISGAFGCRLCRAARDPACRQRRELLGLEAAGTQ